MRLQVIALAGAIGLASNSMADTALAASQLTAAGELRCTVEPVAPGEKAGERSLSCKFKSMIGADAQFTGRAIRLSGPPIVDASLVLIWAVRAPKPDIASRSLGGRYISALGKKVGASATKIGTLRRDGVVPIELKSLTPPTVGSSDRTLILELELRSVRA